MENIGEMKNMTLGFYNGIIYPLALPVSINIHKLANGIIKCLLRKGINLNSVIKKANDNLEENEIFIHELGMQSGLIIPLEFIKMRMGTDEFFKETIYDIWSCHKDPNNVKTTLETIKKKSSGKISKENIKIYDKLYGLIALDLFISIAILLKLKIINDDKKNGFMSYDYEFCIQQMGEISRMRCI
jgi:hypothetical protein